MNKRTEKAEVVKHLKEIMSASSIVIVSHNKGVNVSQANELRRSMRAANGNYLVAKNTLTRIAAQDTKFSSILSMVSGPVSLAYSEDPVSVAKALHTFCSSTDKLQICGAVMDNKLLSAEDVGELASLPSLDELRAKIISLLSAPSSQLVRLTQAPAGQLARVVQAYYTKQ